MPQGAARTSPARAAMPRPHCMSGVTCSRRLYVSTAHAPKSRAKPTRWMRTTTWRRVSMAPTIPYVLLKVGARFVGVVRLEPRGAALRVAHFLEDARGADRGI